MSKLVMCLATVAAVACLFLYTNSRKRPASTAQEPTSGDIESASITDSTAIVKDPIATPVSIESADKLSGAAPHKDWSREPAGEVVDKGIQWLASVQGADGGWGQDGGETVHARQDVKLESTSNDVANTSVSTLALLRAGHTPTKGEYKENVKKAVDYVLVHVEEAKDEGLGLATPSGT